MRAYDKRVTRLEVIKDLLTGIDYRNKNDRLVLPDPETVFLFDAAYLANGRLAG